MKHFFQVILFLLPCMLTSCFSPLDETLGGIDAIDPNAVSVSFHVCRVEQMPFDESGTRAALSDLCSRITLAVFQDDTKVKNINQQVDDSGFGTFNLSLTPDLYQVVIIAHNGLGNCTVSSPDKITFANNKCTDTFYYYGSIEVEEDMDVNIELERCVSMFRFQTLDEIPAEVSKMQFYYTGGSSTFNAVSGFGCVNSRQTETFDLSASQTGQPGLFEVYTFPHAETGDLKMKVTAFDASEKTVAEHEYNPVSVRIRWITSYSTYFFSGSSSSTNSGDINLSVRNEGEWEGVDEM